MNHRQQHYTGVLLVLCVALAIIALVATVAEFDSAIGTFIGAIIGTVLGVSLMAILISGREAER